MPNETLPKKTQITPEPELTVIEEYASNDPAISADSKKLADSEKDNFGELRNKRYSSDTTDRKWLAVWTAITVSMWLIAVIGILICNISKFHLSDTVLSVLLGTTTLNVLGLSYIVLRGHFQSTKELNDLP